MNLREWKELAERIGVEVHHPILWDWKVLAVEAENSLCTLFYPPEDLAPLLLEGRICASRFSLSDLSRDPREVTFREAELDEEDREVGEVTSKGLLPSPLHVEWLSRMEICLQQITLLLDLYRKNGERAVTLAQFQAALEREEEGGDFSEEDFSEEKADRVNPLHPPFSLEKFQRTRLTRRYPKLESLQAAQAALQARPNNPWKADPVTRLPVFTWTGNQKEDGE